MPPSTKANRSARRDVLPPSLYGRKSIACRLCHTRKVRRSGGQLCDNCSCPSECIYPTRSPS
ncbi:hypothetical protein V1525DRAFT_102785 [Lipomyces kononenkoae]|uniref:Uncharacterized protein n=1 Tax=Lipomyces kononenkoae TaxID=34357 RepID=A0ACC3SQQ7_LIPKO